MPAPKTMTALEAAAAVKAQSGKQNAGTKLKETPLFRGTDTLAVNDLNWYTTPDHLVEAAARAGMDLKRKDVVFAEHKVNGKTKGSAVISCHSEENASKLAHWFHNNDFQGKRINPTFLTHSGGNPFKPAPTGAMGPRQVLNTQILLAHGPTNAHGGVNFNRVKPARIAQQVQAQANAHTIGMGWPSSLHKVKGYAGDYDNGLDGNARAIWHNQTLHPNVNPFIPSGLGAEYAQ